MSLPNYATLHLLLCVSLMWSHTIDVCSLGAVDFGPAKILVQWNFLNYTFRSVDAYDSYIDNRVYTGAILAGIKVSTTGKYYVSVPRWSPDMGFRIPATLARLVTPVGWNPNEVRHNSDPPLQNVLLEPFPSWEYNELNRFPRLNSVRGFEIDGFNRMWVLDQGAVGGAISAERGSMQLLCFNLSAADPGSAESLLHIYQFPNDYAQAGLADLVVDLHHNFVYISDSGTTSFTSTPVNASLIVYDVSLKVARRVLTAQSVVLDDPTLEFKAERQPVFASRPMHVGATGIALCGEHGETLLFSALTNRQFSSIATIYLRNPLLTDGDLLKHIKTDTKASVSAGITCSNRAVMYMGFIEQDSIWATPIDATGDAEYPTEIELNRTILWPDTFGFDHKGNLLLTTNRFAHHYDNRTVWTEWNFRLWSVPVDADSYAFALPNVVPAHDPDANSHEFMVLLTLYVMVSLVAIAATVWLIIRMRKFFCPKKKVRVPVVSEISVSTAARSYQSI